MTKIAEGGFNKIFRIVMDNNSTVIARIPYPNVGRSCKTTESEVATMEFRMRHRSLPRPFAGSEYWNTCPKSLRLEWKSRQPCGIRIYTYEEATGRQGGEIWDDLKLADKWKIVEEIVAIEKKLLSSLSFTRYVNSDAGSLSLMGKLSYGSLYIVDDAFPGCEKAEIASDASQSQRKEDQSPITTSGTKNGHLWELIVALVRLDIPPVMLSFLKHVYREVPQRLSQGNSSARLLGLVVIRLQRLQSPRHDMFMVAEGYSQSSADAHIELTTSSWMFPTIFCRIIKG
ncbi:conserved hypothetical protein [Aspergillus lentulus]|nr:conserved hypothetical protein [Aspergillus lentulus]